MLPADDTDGPSVQADGPYTVRTPVPLKSEP